MRILLIWPGRTKNREIDNLIDEYLKRIRRFIKVEILERPHSYGKERNRNGLEKLQHVIPEDSYRVLLDENGREMNSLQFAEFIRERMNEGRKNLAFTICGEFGATNCLQESSDMVLSLSKFTFTHEMARMLLIEQIYRAMTIINNHPYHK